MDIQQLRESFPALTKRFEDADLAALTAALQARRWSRGEALTRFGDRGHTLHLVLSGTISVHVSLDGEELLLGQAGPGCLVGELGLVEPGPSSATLSPLEEVHTLDLTHERFEELCKQSPASASALLRAVSLELVQRLRGSTHELLRRVDDHHWMRVRAREDRPGWLARMASLVRGVTGGA